ncbi:MAG: DUF2157 domain-containing protein [Rhodospirillales bacterium]|nr:DUF2157 domain-containing protein [Rhodospirillales bacterium]
MSTERRAALSLSRKDLDAAASAGVIDEAAADALWNFLATRHRLYAAPRFDFVHLLWYAGALVVIGAMGLFSTEAWSRLGDGALLATALVYGAAFAAAGAYLWHRRGLRVPGGLLVLCALAMAPLAAFALQSAFGWWTDGEPGPYRNFFRWVKASWVPMDVATIVAALLALRYFRFPFLVMPIAVALWFLSMDLAPWILGEDWKEWTGRAWVSLWFGLAVMALAWGVDLRSQGEDYAFWLHLFGGIAFWGGMTAMESRSELWKAVYCAVSVALLFLSVFLARRVYAVLGGLGVAAYLGHLSYEIFEDSLLFPFALSLIGIGLIAAGLVYYRRGRAIEAWLEKRFPPFLSALRPAAAGGAQ